MKPKSCTKNTCFHFMIVARIVASWTRTNLRFSVDGDESRRNEEYSLLP